MINQVFNEDCLEGMKRIPDKSVDMILCDLPYGTTACKWDVIIPFDKLWEQYERVIKSNGAIVLTAAQPFTSALVMSNPEIFKYDWVWEKSKVTGVLNAKHQPLRQHESVLVYYKSKCTYNPQGTKKTFEVCTDKGQSENYGSKKGDAYVQDTTGYPRSILKAASISETIHPTQKPVALFEYLIKTYTNEGETVLDNCMGSGTTAIACINTARNYIGFEKEEKYYKVIQDRIKNHVVQKELFAA
jgi:site-specific DNA-methyltransferase (adenine-specific)